ncbi:MAG: hypothetical protein AVDCRST_MAG30-1745 [uncultured Solirubrobacteraceae bacterium]|uniref:Uncharacterized protein n=1 Tax=uncultured Solirubrobacteraceae bacterium TaxID=1162706 RepID=A0A6J4SG85_9ACTN|nr:MAG: hypothetical protein AVDCRST_MAG30-1745 [uncultured Solirubrobacteraceae bacterium]
MRPARSLLALGVAACAALPTAAVATSGDAEPTATAAGKCGSVTTRNGGTAKYIYAVKVACRTARRVAKRANGRRYSTVGFTCRPRSGGIYGCNNPGTAKGIGFSYSR